jgi:hypothetical protein
MHCYAIRHKLIQTGIFPKNEWIANSQAAIIKQDLIHAAAYF